MRRVILSLTLVLLFSLAVVPVSAWATGEQAAGSTVPASSFDPVSADSTAAVDVPESDAASSYTPEPAASDPDDSAGSDEWSVYELTAVETIWDKPFEEYTPTEGYLFLIFTLILVYLGFRLFKGGVL